MIRAVVVDVDDTLCLTEAACFDLENEVLADIGARPIPRDVHLATWGMSLIEALPIRSPGVDLDRFAVAYPAVLRAYIADGRLDVIPAENLQALERLAADGRAVMVLTSRTAAEMSHLLDDLSPLKPRLTAVYHAGNTRFGKPDPRVFDEFLAATGFDPGDCVYIGDSPGDADAARGAGLHFIACLQSGVRTTDSFAGRGVCAYVTAFPDIVDAVAALDMS